MKQKFEPKKLQKALDDSGLSVPQLAKAMGYHGQGGHRMIYNWLQGKTVPNVDSLARASDALGKPINFFMGVKP